MFKSKLFLNVFAVMIVILVAGVNYAEAQCKKCKISKATQRFICSDGQNGGLRCSVTNDGYTCTADGICIFNPYQEFRANIKYAIKLDPAILRNIGQQQPRFAATLATLCNQGAFSDGSVISWIGEEFNYEDLEYLLRQMISPTSGNNPPTSYFTTKRIYKSEADIPEVNHSITVMLLNYNYKEVKISINAVDSSGKENKFYTLELTAAINTVSKQNDIDVLGLVITNWELK